MITHLETNPYECSQCKKSYRQAASLRTHMLTHTGDKVGASVHSISILNPIINQFYLFSAIQMRYMRKGYDPTKRFQGDFNKNDILLFLIYLNFVRHSQKHLLIHSGEMVGKLDDPISFNNKLYQSILLFLQPYSCMLCGKQFRYSSNFIMHKRSHIGERPFECSVQNCKKKFLSKEQLKRHTMIHSGLRPYACSYPDCGKAFNRRSTLNVSCFDCFFDSLMLL